MNLFYVPETSNVAYDSETLNYLLSQLRYSYLEDSSITSNFITSNLNIPNLSISNIIENTSNIS